MTLLNNLLASLPFMNAERADYLIDSFWPMLEAGLLYTIPLAIVSFIYGVLIALGVAIIRTIPNGGRLIRFLQLLCRIYISIIRGTPMLVQIFIIFYGLPEVGITLEPFPTAIIAFSINIYSSSNFSCTQGAMGGILRHRYELSASIFPHNHAAGLKNFRSFTI